MERGQIELVGGGYYEPILPMIPDADKIAQLRKLADYLRQHFGRAPRGAWVAERVWEPTLPRPLAKAGVEYVVLDDTHFLAAGLQPWQLHGSFVTEEDGLPVAPGSQLESPSLHHPLSGTGGNACGFCGKGSTSMTPSSPWAMTARSSASGPALTITFTRTAGWSGFLKALESCQDWLETTTVADYLSSHPAVGRIYLPTASYAEMMEWSLPPAASTEFKACLEESEHMPNGERFLRFLRGGLWRNFLTKYAESNRIQKQALGVSHRLQKLSSVRGKWNGKSGIARGSADAPSCCPVQ